MISTPNDQKDATIPAVEPNGGKGAETENDKLRAVRRILIGDEVQEAVDRFGKLEEDLGERQSKLHNELMAEFETLQSSNKTEIKELSEMVVKMVRELQAEDTSLAGRIDEFGKRLVGLEARVDSARDFVTKQVRQAREQFTSEMLELTRTVKSQQEETTRRAVSRSEFAEILNGLAGGIAKEGKEEKPSQ